MLYDEFVLRLNTLLTSYSSPKSRMTAFSREHCEDVVVDWGKNGEATSYDLGGVDPELDCDKFFRKLNLDESIIFSGQISIKLVEYGFEDVLQNRFEDLKCMQFTLVCTTALFH